MTTPCIQRPFLHSACFLLVCACAVHASNGASPPKLLHDRRTTPSIAARASHPNVLRRSSDASAPLRSAASHQAPPPPRELAHGARSALNSALPRLSRQGGSQGGRSLLDGDSCDTDEDCRGPRRCLDASSGVDNLAKSCASPSASCFCVNHRICVSAADCDDGELCVLDVGYPTCVSRRVVDRLQLTPVPPPDADAPPPRFGFTGELCSSDDACRGSRKCRPLKQPLADKLSCGPKFMSCTCVGDKFTQCENPIDEDDDKESEQQQEASDNECPDGELCQTVGGNAVCYTAKVSSKAVTEAMKKDPPVASVFAENGGEEDTVCIAMHSLRHLKEHQLLFSQPKVARVLCDSNESCATPGHMVSYNGKLMMMKTYCQMSGCTSRVTYVNSPRFRRAMRIESNTQSLSFTALAARYETDSEERLLSLAVRVGLL